MPWEKPSPTAGASNFTYTYDDSGRITEVRAGGTLRYKYVNNFEEPEDPAVKMAMDVVADGFIAAAFSRRKRRLPSKCRI